jgi:hypothetical protein
MSNTFLISFVFAFAVIFLILQWWFLDKEGFQSAGTLLQLETSHVPTRAEAKREHRWLRKRIHQDLIDLTGSA